MTDDFRKQIGARIQRAQERKFRFGSDAIEELERKHGKKVKAAYYSHRSGMRMPNDDTLRIYAELFDVPFEYLRLGIGADKIETEAAAINKDESVASVVSINQHRQQLDIKPSQTPFARSIPILSAEQIRMLGAGGDLATMSGRTLPTPDFLTPGPDSFAYFIPPHDFSMVAASGPSYAPGACVVIDPQRQIAPGDRVYADIEGFDEPMIRKFVAVRSFTPGLRFRLEAFNPAFQAIEVTEPAQVRVLARVIGQWSAD